ncbi:MAG: hypothetical protein IPH11_00710 [Ignavibacteriales bacterium]|nr:hypothetical protein [Ignavibacteriales bacterium]
MRFKKQVEQASRVPYILMLAKIVVGEGLALPDVLIQSVRNGRESAPYSLIVNGFAMNFKSPLLWRGFR